jgi:hypothetical protein
MIDQEKKKLRDQRRRDANRTPEGKARKKFHRNERRGLKYKVVKNHLLTHPCVDCGNTDIRVLQFDHVRGEKLGNISNIIRAKNNVGFLVEEIAKCDVRCGNCHLIRHYEARYDHQS